MKLCRIPYSIFKMLSVRKGVVLRREINWDGIGGWCSNPMIHECRRKRASFFNLE